MKLSPTGWQTLFEGIVLPELIAWLQRRREANEPPPTKEQILAQCEQTTTTYINAGEDWLRSKGAL